MANVSYNKLLDPISEVITAMESLMTGGFGETGGDQRECYKRIHAYCWGLHTLVMDVITAIGIENAATRPIVLDRFQTLIRPTKTNLDSLLAGFDGNLTEEQSEILEYTRSEIASIEHMMSNLWHYSLLRHGRLVYSSSEFDILLLINKVHQIVTDAVISDPIPPVRIIGDETFLSYALGEIVENVKIHAGVASLSIEMQQFPNRVDITIHDAGSGFHYENMHQTCQPFWQANIGNPGLGLGLYLAKTFIEQNHGTLELSSEPQKGTLVKVSLPCAS